MAVILGDDKPNTLTGTADGDTIEAFGADDFARGNEGDDSIFGGTGNDVLEGNGGNDVVDGGEGDDRMFGGSGVDWLDYSQDPSRIHVDLESGNVDDGFGDEDRVEQFENVFGSVFDDDIFGDEAANIIYGNNGNDYIGGREGADIIFGGKGHDQVWGNWGRDVLYGGEKGDTVGGGDGDDILFGGNGSDMLFGDEKNDVIHGGKGKDGAYGGEGDDDLDGGRKADYLDGGVGDDVIQGGAEDRADDVIHGGGGNDLFLISRMSGDDTIGDFESGNDSPYTDVIDLTALGDLFDDFDDVVARSAIDGGDLVIHLDDTNTLRLVDTVMDELDADNFVFAA